LRGGRRAGGRHALRRAEAGDPVENRLPAAPRCDVRTLLRRLWNGSAALPGTRRLQQASATGRRVRARVERALRQRVGRQVRERVDRRMSAVLGRPLRAAVTAALSAAVLGVGAGAAVGHHGVHPVVVAGGASAPAPGPSDERLAVQRQQLRASTAASIEQAASVRADGERAHVDDDLLAELEAAATELEAAAEAAGVAPASSASSVPADEQTPPVLADEQTPPALADEQAPADPSTITGESTSPNADTPATDDASAAGGISSPADNSSLTAADGSTPAGPAPAARGTRLSGGSAPVGTAVPGTAVEPAPADNASTKDSTLVDSTMPGSTTPGSTTPGSTTPGSTLAVDDMATPAGGMAAADRDVPLPDAAGANTATGSDVEQTTPADTLLPWVQAAVDRLALVTEAVRTQAEQKLAEAQAAADEAAAQAVAQQEAADKAAKAAAEQEAAEKAAKEKAAAQEAARRAAWRTSLQGYRNGRIPAAALCGVPFDSTVRLRCDAAEALGKLDAAYRAAFGTHLTVTDSYRSYAAQVACRQAKGRLCAVPGTSHHGAGIAVDLGGGVNSRGSAAHRWLQQYGARYGWAQPSWAKSGGNNPEPWHWEFTG